MVMIDMKQITDRLDVLFLSLATNIGYAYHISYFASYLEIDREFVRGYLRSLRHRGLMEYTKGLMNDEGGVCGAGYQITAKGALRLQSSSLLGAPQ